MRIEEDGDRFVGLGEARFEPESGEITGPDGASTRLAPQPASLLALLVAEPGRVVTREAIAAHLWPHGSVEIDQGIGYAMREVRKALESVGADPSVVETIPRRGFRVRVETPEPGVSAVNGPGSAPSPPAARVRQARSPFVTPIVIAIAAAAALALTLATRPSADVPVLAVFEHEPSDPAGRALAREIGTVLTTRLTQDLSGRVGVIGPTGTASLAGPGDTDAARERLGACLVLSGGLRPVSGSSVAIFTQLVRTSDRVHVWAATDTVPTGRAVAAVVPRIVRGVEDAIDGCRD